MKIYDPLFWPMLFLIAFTISVANCHIKSNKTKFSEIFLWTGVLSFMDQGRLVGCGGRSTPKKITFDGGSPKKHERKGGGELERNSEIIR